VLAVTGGYLTWRQVDTPPALVHTRFGLMLVAKLALVLVVIALATGARSFTRRRPDLGSASPQRQLRRLRRSVGGEVLFGMVILAVTSALVGLTPARDDYAPPVDATVALPARIAAGLGVASGRIRLHAVPARQGGNVLDVYLIGPGGRLLRAEQVSGRIDAVGRDFAAEPIEVAEAEPGHYVASAVSLPFPGRWALRLDVRVSDFDEYPVTVSFDVR
jgi:copper transport protein